MNTIRKHQNLKLLNSRFHFVLNFGVLLLPILNIGWCFSCLTTGCWTRWFLEALSSSKISDATCWVRTPSYYGLCAGSEDGGGPSCCWVSGMFLALSVNGNTQSQGWVAMNRIKLGKPVVVLKKTQGVLCLGSEVTWHLIKLCLVWLTFHSTFWIISNRELQGIF